MGSGIKNTGVKVAEFLYDFAVDGGAVSTIALSSKANKASLPVGAIVTKVLAQVVTACTSGGSAVVEWGNTADTDGYSGVAVAVASLTAGAVFNGSEDATSPAALIFDNTLDEEKPYYVGSANAADFKIKITTAALTAGKIAFHVMYVLHSDL